MTLRIMFAAAFCTTVASMAGAQTMILATSDADFQITNVFSDVDLFSIRIEIDAPLAAGSFVNPDIVSVSYRVNGVLEPGTPSDFPAFDLQRSMTGAEFYAQGSSLSFTISSTAVLNDGVQVAELVGNGVVLTYNAREVGNGRFHPALFELSANGTGRIQNSDNVITQNPLQQVAFGEEYVTDLMFDPGNATVITAMSLPAPTGGGGSGGAISSIEVLALTLLWILVVGLRMHRRHF